MTTTLPERPANPTSVSLTQNRIPQPRKLNSSHFLVKQNIVAAQSFMLGTKQVNLSINANKDSAGIVLNVPLDSKAAPRLNRKNNYIDCVASGISDPTSVGEILSYLDKLRAPIAIKQTGAFFFLTAQRRKTDFPKGNPFATAPKAGDIAESESFVLGFFEEVGKVYLAILRGNGKGLTLVKSSALTAVQQADDGSQGSAPQTGVSDVPDDPTKVYASCFSDCLNEVPALF